MKITINKGRETAQVLDGDVTMKRFTLVLLMALISLSMLISCAATPELTPSEFEVISLTVTPIVVEPGQAVTINAGVKNTEQREGSCSLTLTVNGFEEEVKEVIVAPGATETLAFTLVRDASGMYEIEVAGLTETLRVKQAGAYPRLANCYCGTNAFYWRLQQFNTSEINSLLKSLARWDIIVVSYSVISSIPQKEHIRQIKRLNPQAKILAYIEAGTGGWWHWLLTDDLEAEDKPSWVTSDFINYMRYVAMYFGITMQDSNESFFLHYGGTQSRVIVWTNDTTGDEWPGMNPAGEWSTYLPQFVNDKVMSSGLFDGVFYDCLWGGMWLNNIDIDNDSVADSSDVVNQKYKEGMVQLLQLTRELLGPEAIILGNPGPEWSANSPYFEYANGHMQECALGTEIWNSHDFAEVWDIYQRNVQEPAPPSRIHWIGVDTNCVQFDPFDPNLPPANLQKMRYGLAITLLDGGYFGFDMGNDFHGELWWFTEYDANLGLAKGDGQKRSDGTWMREFENGVVVANPTSTESTIEFPAIHKDITTGIEGLQFMVPPEDGRIFVMSD